MHFQEISIVGLKGKTLTAKLFPCTAVTGPHESGKSALVEGIRLAATGRAAIGGTGKAMQEIVEGASACATLSTSTETVMWELRAGDTVSSKRNGPDLQGTMPVTLEQFESLSAQERFLLFGSNEICSITNEIEKNKAVIKEARAVLDTPAPTMPDAYEGPARAVLQKELEEITNTIQQHRDASENAASRQQAIAKDEASIAELEQTIAQSEATLETGLKHYTLLFRRLEQIEALETKRDSIKEPKFITWGRKQGLSCGDLIETVCIELAEAAKWMNNREAAVIAEQLERIEFKHPSPIPVLGWEGQSELDELLDGEGVATLQLELKELANGNDLAQRMVSQARQQIALLRKSVDGVNAMYGQVLPQAVLDQWLVRKDELQEQIRKCDAFSYYSEQNAKWIKGRVDASNALDKANTKSEELIKQRSQAVLQSTGAIETTANAILSRMNLPGLSLLIEATAKKAELVVRCNGILLDAMAGSRRLLYGLALLSAIHENSKAQCPVLLAQCGELNPEMFEKAVKAFSPSKGNVVLEHWVDVGVENCVRLEEGVLV